MSLKKMEIRGFRGFNSKQTIKFAVPNDTPSSGLTIITGANNSGKSSIIECLKARGGSQSPSFTVGARNSTIDKVEIAYFVNGKKETLSSLKKGGSETKKDGIGSEFKVFVLPSRRAFNPFFGRGLQTRDQYLNQASLPAQRSSIMDNFQYRLFNILENQEAFNQVLHKVLKFKPKWSIDQSDQGQYFLKFFNGKNSHTSDGMGEGIVSIFAIVDSLYDSKKDDVIVIDEPELSLHPALQKRVFALISEFSKDRQIIISTHSPYFVDIDSLINGSNLIRVINEGAGTKVFQLSSEGRKIIKKLAQGNLYNPHTFGLDARELFFQEDGIVIVEGQEDVLFFPEIARQLDTEISASFFGWGAGGASNINYICELLENLGFKKVAAILDGDKKMDVSKLKKQFPKYHFSHINADDIRNKKRRPATKAVKGLLDNQRKVKKEYKEDTIQLIQKLNTYMT